MAAQVHALWELSLSFREIVVDALRKVELAEAALIEQFPKDQVFVLRSVGTMRSHDTIRVEIIQAEIEACRLAAAAAERSEHSLRFERDVLSTVAIASQGAASIRSSMQEKSCSTVRVNAKAQQVATAAEQSASSMREAAETAAELAVRSIL